MKTITVVHKSEYKKLSSFEHKLIKFCKNKSWLFVLIPISLFFMVWICHLLNNFWYLIPYFIVYFFSFLAAAERYGKVSTTTDYCSHCNSKMKYLGKDYYSDFYCCDNSNCKEYKKDIEC